jgi:hypothetical protein
MSDEGLNAALLRFDEEYIVFPPFVAAAEAIENNLTLYREVGIARHLLVLGESGTGKSSLCNWLLQKHPRQRLKERDVVPILVVPVPSTATVAGLVEAALEALGDPMPTLGNIPDKTRRFVKLTRTCGVEMVLFDEAQHLHDRGRDRSHYAAADWLKTTIDALRIPTVFLGIPRLEALLQVNDQLRRRFSRRIRMELGQSETETVDAECLQLVVSLGACLPIPLNAEPYGWKQIGLRMYYASDGRVSYIKTLLAGGMRMALEAGMERIGPDELEKVFTQEIWWEGVGQLNPFNANFDFRRLDRGNEPFERHEQAGKRNATK